jgi:hypothetical protein
MDNLAQYGVGRQSIQNGRFEKTYAEPQGITATPGTQVSDGDIQHLLRSELAGHNLPLPDENTLYFVFLPANVTLQGREPDRGYHGSFPISAGKPEGLYAVVRYEADPHHEVEPNNPHLTTSTVSHELAEAVANPVHNGWYFINDHEEIADIPNNLYDYGWITPEEHWDVLIGFGGQQYLVQRVWSNSDNRPVAFR